MGGESGIVTVTQDRMGKGKRRCDLDVSRAGFERKRRDAGTLNVCNSK